MSGFKSSKNRYRERGSVLVIAMIALVALVSLGSLTIITVRSGVSSTSGDRFKAVALFAAEAGVAVAIEYARTRVDPVQKWSALVEPFGEPPLKPTDLPGNGAKPGEPGNLFDPATRAWYEVEFLNNLDDGPAVPVSGSASIHIGYRDGVDTDGRIIIRVTGHGPNNAAVGLEVEIESPQFGAGKGIITDG